jgi:hypothetical protein
MLDPAIAFWTDHQQQQFPINLWAVILGDTPKGLTFYQHELVALITLIFFEEI